MNGRQAKALRKAARTEAKTAIESVVKTTSRYERTARVLAEWADLHGRHIENRTLLRLGKWRTVVLVHAKPGQAVRQPDK